LFTRHSDTYAVVPFCALSITLQGLLFFGDSVLTLSTFIHPGCPSGSSGLSDR